MAILGLSEVLVKREGHGEATSEAPTHKTHVWLRRRLSIREKYHGNVYLEVIRALNYNKQNYTAGHNENCFLIKLIFQRYLRLPEILQGNIYDTQPC
jgi:hypothetical protein